MNILKSRSFWTAVVDAIVAIIFLIIGQQFPQYEELALQIWAALQPVVAIFILYFTAQDAIQSFMVRFKEMEKK